MAKALLPEFGGSVGVWVTCMLFFQVVLLLGYLYSNAASRLLGRRVQAVVQVTLLLLSLVVIPLQVRVVWARSLTDNPVLSILLVLSVSLGLPFFLLSTTGPLLQSWFAASPGAALPYRFFALSNGASLAALLAYPVLMEPNFRKSGLFEGWSAAYVAFVLLSCAAALVYSRGAAAYEPKEQAEVSARPLLWISLTACASTLWLAVANHLSQQVAPVPFLWVLPLSLYLLSFLLCFEVEVWYRPALFRWLLPIAWIAIAYQIAGRGPVGGLVLQVVVFSLALFVCCMFCHGELARTKPERRDELTFFYLTVALGGALGGVFVALAAPRLFSTYLELPIGITLCVFLAVVRLYGLTSPKRLVRLAVFAAAAFFLANRFQLGAGDVLHLRNFYGALQVKDEGDRAPIMRSLYNGRTLHGIEFLPSSLSRLATAYYGPDSGVGRVLTSIGTSSRRVGVVGLGVGTLATYGRRGDFFRFYEINPAVIEIASQYFHFLDQSEARTEVIAGDGRLALEREPAASFDILVLDAFADDSIPVHLMTKEAFELYFRLLRSDGVLVIHLTNRYVDLAPVAEGLAEALHKDVAVVHSPEQPGQAIRAADWAILPAQAGGLSRFGMVATRGAKTRQWTDDYSNLFQVLK